jgi:hypothetical protein
MAMTLLQCGSVAGWQWLGGSGNQQQQQQTIFYYYYSHFAFKNTKKKKKKTQNHIKNTKIGLKNAKNRLKMPIFADWDPRSGRFGPFCLPFQRIVREKKQKKRCDFSCFNRFSVDFTYKPLLFYAFLVRKSTLGAVLTPKTPKKSIKFGLNSALFPIKKFPQIPNLASKRAPERFLRPKLLKNGRKLLKNTRESLKNGRKRLKNDRRFTDYRSRPIFFKIGQFGPKNCRFSVKNRRFSVKFGRF